MLPSEISLHMLGYFTLLVWTGWVGHDSGLFKLVEDLKVE